MNLNEVLKEWRWAKKLTTRQFAKMIGSSAATISRIERGENCDGETIAKILRWLFTEAGTDTEGM